MFRVGLVMWLALCALAGAHGLWWPLPIWAGVALAFRWLCRMSAIRLNLTDDRLSALTLGGRRAIPWRDIVGVVFSTSPRRRQVAWAPGHSGQAWPLGVWLPWPPDGVHFIVAGKGPGAVLWLGAKVIQNAPLAIQDVCLRAGIAPPTEYVFPMLSRMARLRWGVFAFPLMASCIVLLPLLALAAEIIRAPQQLFGDASLMELLLGVLLGLGMLAFVLAFLVAYWALAFQAYVYHRNT